MKAIIYQVDEAPIIVEHVRLEQDENDDDILTVEGDDGREVVDINDAMRVELIGDVD